MFELETDPPSAMVQRVELEGCECDIMEIQSIFLWRVASAFTAHLTADLPVLHPIRSNAVLLLATPRNMSFSDIHTFVSSKVRGEFSLLFLLAPSQNSALAVFEKQDSADEFYLRSIAVLFRDGEPHRCVPLFVVPCLGREEVRVSVPGVFPRQFTMPTCPVCFGMFDPLVSSFFAPLGTADFAAEVAAAWGNGCLACQARLSGGRCALCEEPGSWVCLHCGHRGCSRTAGRHAIRHWSGSGHRFAVDWMRHWVWDYVEDRSVDRTFVDWLAGDATGDYATILLAQFRQLQCDGERELGSIAADIAAERSRFASRVEALEQAERAVVSGAISARVDAEALDALERELRAVRNDGMFETLRRLRDEESALQRKVALLCKRAERALCRLEGRAECDGDVAVEIS